jgi:D-lactate dehydrogenase
LDWKSLKSVSSPLPLSSGEGLTVVLTETKASTGQALEQNITQITEALHTFNPFVPVHFTDKAEE